MNILVVRTDKLGDFITALPTLYILKEYNPNNRIIALVSPINKSLAQSCDFIDEVIVDDVSTSVFALSTILKQANIDASITLYSNTRVAFAQFVAGIKVRIAPATKIAQIFYNQRVKQRRSEVKMAEFEYNMQLARKLFPDIKLTYPTPLLRFNDASKVYDIFCINNDISKKVVAFHVGFGGSSDANWSLEEYEILIRTLVTVDKYQIVLTFGPDEKELYEIMQERLKDTNIVFYLSLEGLVYFAKLISNFRAFISTSTGTYHLASLVGCETVTFFADTLFASALRWQSIGDIKKQHNFMIPADSAKRAKVFANVSAELVSL